MRRRSTTFPITADAGPHFLGEFELERIDLIVRISVNKRSDTTEGYAYVELPLDDFRREMEFLLEPEA